MNCKVALALVWSLLAMFFMFMLPPVANWWANIGPEWWCFWVTNAEGNTFAPIVLFQTVALEIAALITIIAVWIE